MAAENKVEVQTFHQLFAESVIKMTASVPVEIVSVIRILKFSP